MSELFDAVDALLASRATLPPPAERKRLRAAHGLTIDEVATALKVRRATVSGWENGKTEPRPPERDAYARLLDKLAELYPADATAAPVQEAAVPATFTAAPIPAESHTLSTGQASEAAAMTATENTQTPAPAPVAAAPAAATRPARTTRTSSTSRRFFEIIVDEAQDCSALDLAILARLHRAGIPLVIVADTDQGIYEWNDARPEDLDEFTQHISDHLELTGNWRSSPAICQLAATLRPAARTTPDIAVGDHHDAARPLLLLPYGKHRKQISALANSTDAGEAFTRWAAHADIDAADCLALAYRNTAVPKARTRPAPQLPKDQNAIALAWAAAVFSATDTQPASRAHALAVATTFLREYWYPDEPGTLTELLTQYGLTSALLRRRAAAFLHALPAVDEAPARQWRKQARLVLQDQTPPAPAITPAPPRLLSLATADLDKPIRSLIGLPEQTDEAASARPMRSSSIHQAKGSEAEAVLIHLPKPQDVAELIDAWTSPSTDTASSELLRVYDVAITRARQLLALTYPCSKHGDITALLDAHHIEHQTETAPPAPTVL